MGMFKYSSEVVPTQTLQLNTMKVCLYVFETHDLKLPSAEQEAILSSCKNNSSRWFFFFFFPPLPYWDAFDKLQSPFQQSLKYFRSPLPQPVIRTGTGDGREAKRGVSGFPAPPRTPQSPSPGCGYFAVWRSPFLPQPSQTGAYIPADGFSICRC